MNDENSDQLNEDPSNKPLGKEYSPPVRLREHEERLCKLLDEKYSKGGENGFRKSDMLRGALSVLHAGETINNPDYIPQAAHSLREIIYRKNSINTEYLGYIIGRPLSAAEDKTINDFYNEFSGLAHHRKIIYDINKMRKRVESFVNTMNALLGKATKPYKNIDEALLKGPGNGESVNEILKLLKDSKEVSCKLHSYIFSMADKEWLKYFEGDDLLSDRINKARKSSDNKSSGFAEINYLRNTIKDNPHDVAKILTKIKNIPDQDDYVSLNFIPICSELPYQELITLIPKLCDEGWLHQYTKTRFIAYGIKPIVEKLHKNDHSDSLFRIFETALQLNSSWSEEDSNLVISPIDQIESGMMHSILEIKTKEFRKQIIKLLVKKINELIKITHKNNNSDKIKSSFDYYDSLGAAFQNISFLSDKPEIKTSYYGYQDDLRFLLFILKELMKEEILNMPKDENAIDPYAKFIGNLHDQEAKLVNSQATYRLRLYLMSLDISSFQEQIPEALEHLFQGDVFAFIMDNEEYYILLRDGFHALSNKHKEDYILRVITLYQDYAPKWKRGVKEKFETILGMLCVYIENTPTIKDRIHSAGLIPNYDYKPKPDPAWKITTGWVSPQSPITEEEFNKIKVPEVAQELKKDWTEDKLSEVYKDNNVLSPINVEGVGTILSKDIPKRFEEYCENYNLFLDKDLLDHQYVICYISGIEESIKQSERELQEQHLDSIINFCRQIIRLYGNGSIRHGEEPIEHNEIKCRTIIMEMIRLLKSMMEARDRLPEQYLLGKREKILSIIEDLLSSTDPVVEQEETNTAEEFSSITDPCNMAINSVRGTAYELLISFADIDKEKYDEEVKNKIDNDIKTLLEKLLEREKTRAIMFLFGHHFLFFYYNSPEWSRKIFTSIFPDSANKKHLYTAAWEGILSKSLYGGFFVEPIVQELYQRGLKLKTDDFPVHQKQFVNPFERIAEHIALARIHLERFNEENPLYIEFLNSDMTDMHSHFIKFWGGVIKDHSKIGNDFWKERTKQLWQYMLQKYDGYTGDKNPLMEIDSLINFKQNELDPIWLAEMLKQTLEKTKGKLSFYYDLDAVIEELAKIAPEQTIEILNLLGVKFHNEENSIIQLGEKCKSALIILHENEKTSAEADDLQEALVKRHGPFFRFDR